MRLVQQALAHRVDRVLTLSQLVGETGLPRSTAHRLLVQLERVGALERTRVGWRIGVGMFELGQLVATAGSA